MAILLLILVFSTTLLAAVAYFVLLTQGLVTRIWMPGAIGLAAAGITLTLTISSRLPASIRVVELPALAAAIASCIAVRKKQWKTVLNAELKASLAQTIVILLCVVIGFFVGFSSGVGKPVLIALNQDVVGVLPSEQREIAIIGAMFLASVFGIVGVISASALPIAARRAADKAVNSSGGSDEF
jgi:hypothetical protein